MATIQEKRPLTGTGMREVRPEFSLAIDRSIREVRSANAMLVGFLCRDLSTLNNLAALIFETPNSTGHTLLFVASDGLRFVQGNRDQIREYSALIRELGPEGRFARNLGSIDYLPGDSKVTIHYEDKVNTYNKRSISLPLTNCNDQMIMEEIVILNMQRAQDEYKAVTLQIAMADRLSELVTEQYTGA